ncbi:hypothetical protein ACL1A3_12925 [Corynebacterium striatum]
MVVDYLSSQPNRAGYQVSTKKGSGPTANVLDADTTTPAGKEIAA